MVSLTDVGICIAPAVPIVCQYKLLTIVVQYAYDFVENELIVLFVCKNFLVVHEKKVNNLNKKPSCC